MILAVLTCGHRLSTDDGDQAETSEYCPGCGLWVGVDHYEDIGGVDE